MARTATHGNRGAGGATGVFRIQKLVLRGLKTTPHEKTGAPLSKELLYSIYEGDSYPGVPSDQADGPEDSQYLYSVDEPQSAGEDQY
jgi:hypothetical protein